MNALASADMMIEHLLPLVDTAPGADPEKIDTVLRSVGLPDAPAYRALLERSNGIEMTGAVMYSVDDEGDIDAISEPLDFYSPVIPLVGSTSHAHGWHRDEEVWCRFDPIGGLIEETYPSDLAALHEAFAHYVPGYEASVRSGIRAADADALPAGTLPERLSDLDEDEAPRNGAPFPTDEAVEEFVETADATPPLDYRDFLTRFDGLEAGDLVVFGAADMVEQQKDAPEDVVLVGTLADDVLVFDARGRCWAIIDADLDLDEVEDTWDTFSELLAEALDRALD